MTTPQKQPPTRWLPNTTKTVLSDDEDDERLARAFEVEDRWVDDFIKRLNYAIEHIVPKNELKAASVGGLFRFKLERRLGLALFRRGHSYWRCRFVGQSGLAADIAPPQFWFNGKNCKEVPSSLP
jgi:hypothetical protein